MIPGPTGLFLLTLEVAAIAHGLEFNKKLGRFFAEQASSREWASASFLVTSTGSEHEISGYIKAMSNNFILSGKWSERRQRELFPFRAGVIFKDSYHPRYPITSPTLIFAGANSVNALRSDLNNFANNSVNIGSDIVLAYLENNCSAVSEQCCEVYLEQVYKIAGNLTSLPVGNWTEFSSFKLNLLPPENHLGNKRAIVRVGIKNASAAADELDNPNLQTFAEKEEEVHLINLLKNIFAGMNVGYDLIEFPKLGWKNDEGSWTHLLGAVSDDFVHVAADTIDLSTDGVREHMMLTNPIIQTISAVYMRRAEDVHLKDVVLGTFSLNLQLCVLFTGLLLTAAMLTVTLTFCNRQPNARRTEPSEAVLWTLGVLCMQGSPWKPKSFSGSFLLLMTLLFAMMIYNSFAAFITSLLSVNDNPFRTLDDLLKTPVMFGYVAESPEEHFLRTDEDDITLRTLYYRGLVGNGGVDGVAEGMIRAARDKFALFATARLARRTLHAPLSSQWRCKIMELPVAATKTAAAIPLAPSSPYNTLINFWLIRLRETGILARIQRSLVPPMPTCIVGQTFHGATIGDLQTAFGALILGHVSAVTILVIEILWARKKSTARVGPRGRRGNHLRNLAGKEDALHHKWLQSHYVN